ncbi:MAG: signal peptide peptidase SppA [Rickettsiales bacterium]
MAINADTLLDRLYLKSQITRWRILAFVCAVIAVVAVFERFSAASPIQREFIARITFDGFIGDDRDIYELIDDVAQNPKAKAIIVWLDTPGGSAVGGEEIFLRLRAAAKDKPVVAVMRSISASAGYMIALAADHIVAREGTITGSIGVIIESAEITELAQNLGIQPIVIKSSALKASPNPLEKSTPEAESVLRGVIMDFHKRFVDMVAERRPISRQEALQLADGRVYSGRNAVKHKLIDSIGGEEEAVQWLIKNGKINSSLKIKDISLDEKKDWLEAISQSVAGKFFQKSRLGLDGLVAIWHPELK